MVKTQTVRQSVNKKKVIGFEVSTSDASAVSLVSKSDVAGVGASTIRELWVIVTGDKAYIGLGKTATTTPGEDNIPVPADTILHMENIAFTHITGIRSGATDVTFTGWVVVN